MQQEFDVRDVRLLAVSLEDRDVESFKRMAGNLPQPLPFQVAADIDHRSLPGLQHTSAYYLDPDGRIAQVFPMETYSRANWWAIIAEIDRLQAQTQAESRSR